MRRLPTSDFQLVQIVDAALRDVTRKSGDWLVCQPGCAHCCLGVFAINQLDAARLRDGFELLALEDPQRAARVRQRAQQSSKRLLPDFPGNPRTGVLGEDPDSQQRFEAFAINEPCPVLDPSRGTCDLYASRPMTCRVFGPPVRSEDGIGVCELCYHGATAEEIAACEMIPDPDDLESRLVAELEQKTGNAGQTIVAFALGL
jgi:Fe-S-cluster containining protein